MGSKLYRRANLHKDAVQHTRDQGSGFKDRGSGNTIVIGDWSFAISAVRCHNEVRSHWRLVIRN
jgi:hypothetical protein